jgi:MFS family permease
MQPAAGPAAVQADANARRCRLASSPTATILGALVFVLTVIAVPLAGLTAINVGSDVVNLIFAGVGIIVARRQPRNPIGWILLIFIFMAVLGDTAGAYAVLVYTHGRQGLPLGPVAVLLAPLGYLAIPVFPLLILLFPDGRLTSRRWRWVLWAYAALVAFFATAIYALTIAAVASDNIRLDSTGTTTNTDRPPGWIAVLLVPILLIWLSFMAHQVLSWRRATAERREQLKWLACGAGISLASFVAAVALGSTSALAQVLFTGIAALPVSIGVGILKYRLYDIDRIISRTLAYAIVTGMLVGVYAALVLLTTAGFGVHSSVAVAASTLAAAALFNPVRRRVQQVVDRRFNRARYDADQTIAAFAARLKDAVDLDSVRDDLAGVVQQALEPARVSVWISQRD